MPFSSKAQRRKFYAMKNRGEMSQKKINEWESHTPNKIPERVHKKKAALLSTAYQEGCAEALSKLGMDAEAFEAFAQEDETAAEAPGELEDEDPAISDEMRKLINPPSPWNGAELLDNSAGADL